MNHDLKNSILNQKKVSSSGNNTSNNKPTFRFAGIAFSVFLLPCAFPSLRTNLYGLISSMICTGLLIFDKLRPSSTLMELANQIHDEKPNPELQARIHRIKELKSIAKPPMLPEEELKLLDTSPSPRFTANDPELLSFLDTNGYVVVNLETTPSTIKKLKNLLWNYLEENFVGWKQDSPETWINDKVPNIWAPDKGIIFGAGIGHSEFLWEIRTLPGVKEAFSMIWGDDNLITSFDGANIFRPWDVGGGSRDSKFHHKTCGGWWHVDQGKGKTGQRHAVQGLVSLYGANASTGGLCVMPQSQSRHDEVVQDAMSSRDYVSVQNYLPGYSTMRRKLVCCEPGDLILWDSRTIHCNTPATHVKEPHNPNELLRAVAYVCMTPRQMASDQVLEMRRTAYNYRVTTSHWPHVYHPGQAGDEDKPSNDYNTCTEERRKLIG
mmetsp:Transcript_12203/g.14740  ORF Transcript_12203/g.14740 Transcript_12203/m.14740 type:complete len:436 (+) Transcript_12203:103-1410(+)